jgi:hypothetical protein
MSMSSKTSSRGSKVTPPSNHLLLRCKEGPCPQGQYRTSSRQTPTSIWTSYGSSSIAWSLPSKGGATSTTSRGYCLRSNEQPSCEQAPQWHPTHLSHNNHSLTHQVGTSKTEGRSTSTSLAMMGCNDQPSGSSAWMGDEWPATLMGIPPLTSPSLLTSMPPLTPEGRITCPEGF